MKKNDRAQELYDAVCKETGRAFLGDEDIEKIVRALSRVYARKENIA